VKMQSAVSNSDNPRRSRSPSPSSVRSYRARSAKPLPRLPVGSIPPRRDGRLSTHIATSVNIRREGRIAITPCGFCATAGVTCYVGSLARKCAQCARAGRMVEMCGVDRHQYRYYHPLFLSLFPLGFVVRPLLQNLAKFSVVRHR
jgi:hypothetical protein